MKYEQSVFGFAPEVDERDDRKNGMAGANIKSLNSGFLQILYDLYLFGFDPPIFFWFLLDGGLKTIRKRQLFV